jgi:hypothetical protein
VILFARRKAQSTPGNGHCGIRGDHVNVIRSKDHAVPDLDDGHGRFFGDEFGQHAAMFGVEMLNQDESHSRVCGT